MKINHSTKEWSNYFRDRGLPDTLIDVYVLYVEKLNKNNAPIIFEFEHLSKLLGLKITVLASLVNSPSSHYRKFSIPKRAGGLREIHAPYPALLEVQRWINRNILKIVKINESAHGFCANRSIITNAKKHLAKKCLLKMDVEKFFPSIKINHVINIFNEIGYAPNVSFYLAALCCVDGEISQGAATSPTLSNIFCRHLDSRLNLLANSYGLDYTRYADDLAFSGSYIPNKLIDVVSGILEECGLKPNNKKTWLSTNKSKRILTGISISGDELKLPRTTKRHLRQEMFFIEKYGILSHISKNKIRDPYYIESLYGKICFWKSVEPNCIFANKSLEKLLEIKNILGSNDLEN